VANEVLKLAYEAAGDALKQQDSTLGNLRTRATGLLAAAAVGTSFVASVGLYKSQPGSQTLPTWAEWSLLALTILIGASVMLTLWPTNSWNFGANPPALLASRAADIDDVYAHAAQAMVTGAEANDAMLRRRFLAYRFGVAALILQVATLVLGVLIL
jgi:hypothetical protein